MAIKIDTATRTISFTDGTGTFTGEASSAGLVTNGVYLTSVQTLTNKTLNLSNNILTGTLAQFNAALSDADFATGGGTATGTNTGDQTNISGNAGTVTNGVYTTGDQTIGGAKTFSSRMFVVSGAAATPGITFDADTGKDTGFYWGGDGVIGFTSNAVHAGQIVAGGNLTMVGNVTAYSDERLKTNWQGLPLDFVERLAQIKSGTFDRLDVEMTQVGVSAQSLQTLMPEAVLTDTDGMLSVSYGNAALAACVELAKQVVELKQRLAALEAN